MKAGGKCQPANAVVAVANLGRRLQPSQGSCIIHLASNGTQEDSLRTSNIRKQQQPNKYNGDRMDKSGDAPAADQAGQQEELAAARARFHNLVDTGADRETVKAEFDSFMALQNRNAMDLMLKKSLALTGLTEMLHQLKLAEKMLQEVSLGGAGSPEGSGGDAQQDEVDGGASASKGQAEEEPKEKA
ncbi:hypothetical protein KVR01_011846 [Diaporthe batatas]|uniref:uncharacterized protein n=1 Tax=Diaporthe batatas TaxID=748121 RepID=UPI001D046BF1|nr:uncharacterized protein KVR01_011846 [Diaporthe batatas]KAG8158085.1 hypothetical protein KVR01_011846 [Diaporthe batatas]